VVAKILAKAQILTRDFKYCGFWKYISCKRCLKTLFKWPCLRN